MKLQGKKVLVTGAGGFVGSHLVEALVKYGSFVKAFVHYNSRNDWGFLEDLKKDILDQLEIFSGDLRDSDCVRKVVKGQEVIFHLGALIGIPYSYINPSDVVETNVKGTLNLLLASLDYNIERFVHTSTSEVYGTAQYTPIDENHPLNPQSPYAVSKASADFLAKSFFLTYSLPVAIIRPFNLYGPRQSARAVIPNIVAQGLIKDQIKIGSLSTTRDFTYIEDAIKGFIDFAECEKTLGEVVNLGSGNETSIEKLIKIIGELLDKKLKIFEEKERKRPQKSEVQRLVSNSEKAKKLFGWSPEVRFNEGLTLTINWIKKNLNRYKTEIYNI